MNDELLTKEFKLIRENIFLFFFIIWTWLMWLTSFMLRETNLVILKVIVAVVICISMFMSVWCWWGAMKLSEEIKKERDKTPRNNNI